LIIYVEKTILLNRKEMKKLMFISILAALLTTGTIMAQDHPDEYIGLPGDNLNLYAVMNLFQESQTLEDFERNLNDANSRINNLDLNGDNMVDYITINDYVDGNVHNIVLRDALNQNETQDVAVFTVQRFSDGNTQIQLIGDEALYGKNYIVEPINDNNYAGTSNPGYTGVARADINIVADWPLIRYMYYPGYTSWHSSWYWGYYPSYWNPWRPYYWDYYYGYHYNNYPDYYMHYRRWNSNRYDRYNDFYYSNIRSHSTMFDRRIREGRFRDTYSRPDMRRQGENFYARTHLERNGQGNSFSRRSDGNPGSRSNMNAYAGQRQNNSQSQAASVSNRSFSRTESAQRSGNPQRSASPVSNRSVSRPESVQRSGYPQRSTSPVSNRSVSRPDYAQRSGNAQRSAPPVSNRSVSRLESSQRSGYTQRSAPPVSNRSVSRLESSQRSGYTQRSAPPVSNRSVSRPESAQRQSSPQRQAPSARSSSSGSSRSSSSRGSSVSRNDNSRSSGSSQSSHRR
jgi:hypothetical protein